MKSLSLLVALCALALPTGASAQVAPDAPEPAGSVTDGVSNTPAVTPKARLLVDAIDIRLTPQAVASAGLTEPMAAALAVDTTGKRYTRVRAVGALGVLGSDSARRLIELLATADADHQVRVQAVISLSRIWGADDRDAVAGFLSDRLADAPPVVADAISRELAHLYR